MVDWFADAKLALAVLFFVYLVMWLSGFVGSKKLGILIGGIVAYLTFFSHTELLILVLVFFFCFPIFEQFAKAFEP